MDFPHKITDQAQAEGLGAWGEPHEPPLSDDPTFWNAAFNSAFSTFTFVIGFGLGFYVAFRSLGH